MEERESCVVCPGLGALPKLERVEGQREAVVPCHVACFSDDRFAVRRCANCGSINAVEEVDLPKYYARYPFKDHRLDFHTRVAYRNRLALLRRVGIREDDTVLDFGCGKGLFVEVLRRHGFKSVAGYDAFIPEFSDPSVLSRSFDTIVSYDVIEHVDDPIAFFNQMVAALKPGGRLLIGTPNADNIPLSWNKFPPVELSQPYHRHILSRRALQRLGERAALKVLAVQDRFYFDTWVPTVNTRFIWEYVYSTGGFIDVCVKPLRWQHLLRSPRLIFFALFGYLFPPKGNMVMVFRKPVGAASSDSRRVANA